MLLPIITWEMFSSEQGKLEEAIEAYKKAISIEPDNAEAYSTWAMLSKSAS